MSCKGTVFVVVLRTGRTIARTLPASAKVVNAPVYTPLASKCPMLICTLAWSLAVISLLVHELRADSTK